MSRKLSEVSLAYIQNVYNLDLARREFERQALAILDQVKSDLDNIVRRQPSDTDMIRWRSPEIVSPSRETAWLKFNAAAIVVIDVKPKGFRNFKKEGAFVYFEILFDDDKREFVFQARFENQTVHQGLSDFDEKIIEIARSDSNKQNYPNSTHIKASTAIIYKYPLDDALFENLSPIISNALMICDQAAAKLIAQPDDSVS